MNIIKRPSPNYFSDRRGWKPDMIVNHITEGSLSSALSWLTNPKSNVSANYLVGRNGTIYELVPITRAAWCNGTAGVASGKYYWGRSTLAHVRSRATNANYYSISIEHEGILSQTQGALTEAQYQATLWLHKHIRAEVKRIYGVDIPIDREHIVGHYQIAPKEKPYCPGPQFPWNRLISGLKKGTQTVTTGVKDQSILGPATVSAEAALAWVLSKVDESVPRLTCTLPALIGHYWTEAQAEGVRPELALCLSIKETGWWRYGGIVQPAQNNFGGLGAFNSNKPGEAASFADARTGVRAVVQHMRGYATKEPLKQANVDPRYQALVDKKYLGIAPTVHGLSGKWAWPGYDTKKHSSLAAAYAAGETYGQDITRMYEMLLAFAKSYKPETPESKSDRLAVIAANAADVGAALRIVSLAPRAVYVHSIDGASDFADVVQVGGAKQLPGASIWLSGKDRYETDQLVSDWIQQNK